MILVFCHHECCIENQAPGGRAHDLRATLPVNTDTPELHSMWRSSPICNRIHKKAMLTVNLFRKTLGPEQSRCRPNGSSHQALRTLSRYYHPERSDRGLQGTRNSHGDLIWWVSPRSSTTYSEDQRLLTADSCGNGLGSWRIFSRTFKCVAKFHER